MRQASTVVTAHGVSEGWTVGLDLGDRKTHFAVIDGGGDVVERGVVATGRDALRARFALLPPSRVVLEVSTHSRWVSALFGALGHTVIVANARQLQVVSRNHRKSDRVDAELLARLGRVDPELLHPLRHRGEEAHRDLAVLRARDALVRTRTALIDAVRGQVKAHGERLPACSAEAFHRRVADALPASLRPALLPLVETVSELTRRIRGYEVELERIAARYPEVGVLRQPRGVGPITALAFVLTIDDPHRFRHSRMAGAFLGLVPRRQQSGDRDPELHISKAGDGFVRKLLIQCAHYILGPFGEDSDLRRWGLRLAGEGSSVRKRRAVVAVARKLATLLHHLWVSGELYQPLRAAA